MKLKEKVEGTIEEVKMTLKPEETEKRFVTVCFYTGKNCKVICGVEGPEETRAIMKDDIPCTAQEYTEFARSCKEDCKWIVQKLLFWKGAICYYRE